MRAIIEQNPPSALRTAAVNIDELLDMGLGEDRLAEILNSELGVYYMPTADGLAYTTWLRSVRDLLVSSIK